MKCKRCGNELEGRRTSYCSSRCSKLHLKSLYRKRNRERLAVYNREYRKQAPDAYFVRERAERDLIMGPAPMCLRCHAVDDLQLAHIVPHWSGGTKQPNNMVALCRSCHHEFDERLRGFWPRRIA
ncbi:HNH endonuclease [Streptomyces cinereoruber]|uniref:HNH endonuclease n=1 Tax=Streptomyces cinereoruber TaxID=67260 RepID=UPI00362AB1E7